MIKLDFKSQSFGKADADDYPIFAPENKYGYRLNVNNKFLHPIYEKWVKEKCNIIPSDKERMDWEREIIEKLRNEELKPPSYPPKDEYYYNNSQEFQPVYPQGNEQNNRNGSFDDRWKENGQYERKKLGIRQKIMER